jgi:hypothetical protein
MARNINNRQTLRVTPPRPRDPIARLLPRFKPQATRNRTSTRGRAARTTGQTDRDEDTACHARICARTDLG